MLFGDVTQAASIWGPHSKVVSAEVNTPLLTSAKRLSPAGGLQSVVRANSRPEELVVLVLLRRALCGEPAFKPLIPQF